MQSALKNVNEIIKFFDKPELPHEKNIFDINLEANEHEFASRLITLLIRHKSIFIEDNSDEKSLNITQLTNSFHASYNLVEFLNDYNQYITQQQRNNSFAEDLYNKLIEQSNGVACEVAKCKSIACNGRSRILCGNNDDFEHETVFHDIFDSIHVHVYHSFDMGYKLLQSERDMISNCHSDDTQAAKLSQITREKVNNYGNQRRKYANNEEITLNNYNKKFITIIPESISFYENMMKELSSNNNNCLQTLNTFQLWLKNEEYDTDAISDDISDEKSNIKMKLNDRCYTLIKNYFSKNNPQKLFYSFGFRY
eukprot:267332_1